MEKISRNDKCPCGSGKKYKNCCLNNSEEKFSSWKKNAEAILADEPHKDELIKAFFAVLEFIDYKRWEGACHAASATFYILLSELGLNPVLCLGEVKADFGYFDHSWIELNGVYDVAIYLALDKSMPYPPVIKGFSIETKLPTQGEYGSMSGKGSDIDTITIRRMSFDDYMSGFPAHKNGLWGIAQDIGMSLGLKLNLTAMKAKYRDTEWCIK